MLSPTLSIRFVLSHTLGLVDKWPQDRTRCNVLSPTKIRVITHRSTCFHTPQRLFCRRFFLLNQWLANFRNPRNSIFNSFNKLQGCGQVARALRRTNAPPLGGFAPAGSSGPLCGPPPAPKGAPARHPPRAKLAQQAIEQALRPAPPTKAQADRGLRGSQGKPCDLATLRVTTLRALRPGQIAPGLSATRTGRPLSRAAVAAPITTNETHQKPKYSYPESQGNFSAFGTHRFAARRTVPGATLAALWKGRRLWQPCTSRGSRSFFLMLYVNLTYS